MRLAVTGAVLLTLALPMGIAATAGTARSAPPFASAALAGAIPEPMLGAYLDAAEEWDIDWALLAAVGKIECDHYRNRAAGCWPPGSINSAGARGPMQFLGSTWRSSAGRYDLDVAGPPPPPGQGYGTDGDGDGIADPWSAYDAVHAAARFLVALGGRDDPRLAAKRYYAGPANPDPTAGEDYADAGGRAHGASTTNSPGAGGPGSPSGPVVRDGYALPFDPAGLEAVTTHATPPRDPDWALTKPHHSGRIAADIPLPVGTPLYALVDSTVAYAGPAGNCGYTVTLHHAPTPAYITYCHLSRIEVATGTRGGCGRAPGRVRRRTRRRGSRQLHGSAPAPADRDADGAPLPPTPPPVPVEGRGRACPRHASIYGLRVTEVPRRTTAGSRINDDVRNNLGA